MDRRGRWRWVAGLVLAAGLCGSVGCQTWEGGMTLPSPHYLRDRPDYIPQAPEFPLSRELIFMQSAQAGVIPPAGAVAPVGPVAPPPGGQPPVPPPGPVP
jgi:hypothetical protein